MIKLALVDVRKVRILLRKNHMTRCFELAFKEDLKTLQFQLTWLVFVVGKFR
jgi:hypothetical protein